MLDPNGVCCRPERMNEDQQLNGQSEEGIINGHKTGVGRSTERDDEGVRFDFDDNIH